MICRLPAGYLRVTGGYLRVTWRAVISGLSVSRDKVQVKYYYLTTEVILGDLLKFRHIVAIFPAQLAFAYIYMVFVRLFLYLSTLSLFSLETGRCAVRLTSEHVVHSTLRAKQGASCRVLVLVSCSNCQ